MGASSTFNVGDLTPYVEDEEDGDYLMAIKTLMIKSTSPLSNQVKKRSLRHET